jgi:hypothetical protein
LYGCRRYFYHKYGSSIGFHTGISCSLEHLNVSGSATLHFRLQPGMPFNPFANFNKLKELNLSVSMRLQSVHLRDLPNLEVLNLVNCKKITHSCIGEAAIVAHAVSRHMQKVEECILF